MPEAQRHTPLRRSAARRRRPRGLSPALAPALAPFYLDSQYELLFYANDSAHALDATKEDLQACDDNADELVAADVMLVAYALTPRGMATSVRADSVTDGPYNDSKEIVAGFFVIDAPDLDAALAIARTNPAIREGGGVEVRPVHSGGVVERTDQ